MPDSPGKELIVIEVFGEGVTDIGKESAIPRLPDAGVVPIFTHRLCNKPERMRVKTKPFAHLQGKRLWQKVWFAKRQASYNKGSRGVVFVLDTEGDINTLKDLEKGCDHGAHEFPMAVGIAHLCTEAWLLVDAVVLQQALKVTSLPALPAAPESLPAPKQDRKHNPKSLLAECGARSQAQKDKVAQRVSLQAVRDRCPRSFLPFALEVETHLLSVFD
jgi:hypothetical protein